MGTAGSISCWVSHDSDILTLLLLVPEIRRKGNCDTVSFPQAVTPEVVYHMNWVRDDW